jgi:hypothetical protein
MCGRWMCGLVANNKSLVAILRFKTNRTLSNTSKYSNYEYLLASRRCSQICVFPIAVGRNSRIRWRICV